MTVKPGQRSLVSWLIIFLLVCVLAFLLISQISYQKNLRHNQPVLYLPDKILLAAINLTQTELAEIWDPQTLYNKINGKAELYLASGFVEMQSARYQLKPNLWFEALVYQLDASEHSFAVFSQQRRSQGVPSRITENAYSTSNALYLQADKYYLEIIGNSAELELKEAIHGWAEAWLKYMQDKSFIQPVVFTEKTLFPEHGLLAEKTMFIPQNAFGLAGLDQVWLAAYQINGQTVQAFIKKTTDPGQLSLLVQEIQNFWLVQGAELTQAGHFRLEGYYYLIDSQGSHAIGIHEAEDEAIAEFVLQKIKNHLAD